MKTAEERAAELMAQYHEGGALTRMTFAGTLAREFKEYARDQRHACAEAVLGMGDGDRPESRAHALVMNAAFPGEGG